MLIKKSKIPIKEIILFGLFPSFLKRFIYRLKGYKIGRKVSFGLGSVVIGEDVIIDNYTKIGLFTIIRGKKITIERFVKIGSMTMIDTEDIQIGEDSRINENVIIGGIKTPESLLKIGKRVIIMEYSFINPTKPIIIGDDTGIGGHCFLFTHGSWLSHIDGFPVTFAPITLGKNVWLPWRVFIMPGVKIGDNVVIGANSLVSKNLPSNVLAAGSPATIKIENYPPSLDDSKRKNIIDQIFSDFVSYLEYNNFQVERTEVNNNLRLTIKKGKRNYEINYLKSNLIKNIFLKDNLLIIDSQRKEIDTIVNNENVKMWINLITKHRQGTSNVGEEFVKFISRYGIRFNRLD